MIRRICILLLAALGHQAACADDGPAAIAPIVERLNDDRFVERQKAAAALIEKAATEFEDVVLALYAEPMQRDAERRVLATSIMRKIYQRHVLGVGTPYCGWRLERLISDDEDGRMAFSPLVGEVEPGSPAERAGLGEGDEILTLDGEPLPKAGGVTLLQRRIASKRPGDEILLTVQRWKPKFKGSKRILDAKPEEQRAVTIVLGEPTKTEAEPFLEESFASWVALEVDAIQRSSRPASQ